MKTSATSGVIQWTKRTERGDGELAVGNDIAAGRGEEERSERRQNEIKRPGKKGERRL